MEKCAGPRGLSAMTVKPQSVRHLMPFAKSMERYYAQMESALFAAEIACGETDHSQFCHREERECAFRAKERIVKDIPPLCFVHVLRRLFPEEEKGEEVKQQ